MPRAATGAFARFATVVTPAHAVGSTDIGAPFAMICPPLPRAPLVDDWMRRHSDRVSFALHLLGIPPTLVGVLLIPVYVGQMSLPIFLVALAAFSGGYALQFAGHWADGTESGEMRWIKRRWRKFTGQGESDQIEAA